MSDRRRLATTIYGAAAAVATVYLCWPLLGDLRARDPGGRGIETMFLLARVGLKLAIPVAALLLIQRRLTPEARARARAR